MRARGENSIEKKKKKGNDGRSNLLGETCLAARETNGDHPELGGMGEELGLDHRGVHVSVSAAVSDLRKSGGGNSLGRGRLRSGLSVGLGGNGGK